MSRGGSKTHLALLQSQQVIDSLKPECVQEYRGKLNFSLSFDSESNTLYLHILEAIELAARDLNGTRLFKVLG